MQSFIGLIHTIIGLYIWCVIGYTVLSLLYSFQILNRHSEIALRVFDFLAQLVEPALRPLRRVIPMFGTIDITPVLLILLLSFAQNLLLEAARTFLF